MPKSNTNDISDETHRMLELPCGNTKIVWGAHQSRGAKEYSHTSA